MSASRSEADVSDLEFGTSAFYVCLPLQSGRRKRSCLRSAVDPKETLGLTQKIEHWSLTTLREKLVKIGVKVVCHVRYVTFQLAKVAVPRNPFGSFAPDRWSAAKATSTMLNRSPGTCRLTGEVRLGDEQLNQMGLRTRSHRQNLAVRRLRR